ncbi:ABC transporter substrate-binding protein [Secundilactobacillus similis]|uniref:ABC transporter substrate-binding protein n=1 Tax=Secundilactobacillus similis TaxID=414682 RepID=UPI0006D294C5|nr:ABC transporter substrate-binding protein [Secundilactobacillus similis]
MRKSFTALLTISVLATGVLLSGCGKSTSGTKQTATIMEQADISSFDSTMITDVGALETVNNTQEGLYRMKNSTTVEPGLATSIVKPTQNGTVYTFKLRKNLKWSNGDALTANDFVFAWRRAVTPETKAADAYRFLPIKNAQAIENGKLAPSKLGIKALNKTTVQVTLAQATPYFKYLCASVPFLPQDQKVVNKYGKAYGTTSDKTVYSGPFVVKKWTTSSSRWDLTKNQSTGIRRTLNLIR